MRVAITNQKGGVGKTTTTVNLAAGLAGLGRRILIVDLDPQANATTGVGIEHRDLEMSVYECLVDGADPLRAVKKTEYEGLDVLPSSIDLAGAELELVSALARETKLRATLDRVGTYDAVLIDCPPSLGLLTVNALAAAESVLMPIQCEYYALEGVSQLVRNIDLVRGGLNPSLEIGGIVLTMYDARTKLSEEVAAEVRNHFGDKVFSTIIPRSVRLSEAPSYGQPAIAYDASARGSKAYIWLAEEFDRRFFGESAESSEATTLSGGSDDGPGEGTASSVEDGQVSDRLPSAPPTTSSWPPASPAVPSPWSSSGVTPRDEPGGEEEMA